MMRGIDIIGADRGALKLVVVGAQQQVQRAGIGLLTVAVVGAIIGACVWKDHRVLGGLAGLGVGVGAANLADGEYATSISNIVSAGAGVGAALAWKRHPALGFVGASFGTSLVLSPLTKE